MSIPPPAPVFPFEARPLTDPVDPNAVKQFDAQLRQRYPGVGGGIVTLVVICIIAVPFLLIFGTIFTTIAVAFTQAGLGIVIVVFGVMAAGVLALMVWLVARQFAGGGPRERRYRLDAFARANAMQYVPYIDAPRLPGMVFTRGSSRRATDIVRGEQPRFVEFGNHQYTTGSGEDRTTHNWGYVAIHLGTPLPHIVLDALGNNGLFGSSLPASFDKQQRLSLEGDFDQHFALYCPQGYERDALFLFTPDVMARFIDRVGQLDVEIVDDWMFLYTRRPVSTLEPWNWAWLFSAVSALMDKLAQWERWRDERLAAASASGSGGAPTWAVAGSAPLPFQTTATFAPPAPDSWLGPKGVAPPGRRLKNGFPLWAIVLVGVGLLLVLAPVAIGVLGLVATTAVVP
ncbi:hypothetical protein [Microbacterium stercoris]|uniref:Uncharacterized protein n=1 Tax=Microbacterium stercoris TaxID=2820289 RepID=A0A939TSG2_9MICO|nr:hypothetical protein [Microbacterium stercoris]MBO3665146.1 hypothetical protein [Microbacterium stercoris]